MATAEMQPETQNNPTPSPVEAILATPNLTSSEMRTKLTDYVRNLPEDKRAAALAEVQNKLAVRNQQQPTPPAAPANPTGLSVSAKVLQHATRTLHPPVQSNQELSQRTTNYHLRLDQVRTEDHLLREAIAHKIQHWASMIGMAPLSVLHGILEVGAVGLSEAGEKVAFGLSRTISRTQQGWERGKQTPK